MMGSNINELDFSTYTCSHCSSQFRYADEASACQCEEPYMIAQKGSRVRLSLPRIISLHNQIGVIDDAQGPVKDERYDSHGVMTFQFTVRVEGIEIKVYRDQFVPASEDEVQQAEPVKPTTGRMIGESPNSEFPGKPTEESISDPGADAVDEEEDFAVVVIDND